MLPWLIITVCVAQTVQLLRCKTLRATFFRSGKVTVENALDITRYLENELEYIPWKTFVDNMVHFDRMLAGSNVFGDFSVSTFIFYIRADIKNLWLFVSNIWLQYSLSVCLKYMSKI